MGGFKPAEALMEAHVAASWKPHRIPTGIGCGLRCVVVRVVEV
jgi:hypothetical protein